VGGLKGSESHEEQRYVWFFKSPLK